MTSLNASLKIQTTTLIIVGKNGPKTTTSKIKNNTANIILKVSLNSNVVLV